MPKCSHPYILPKPVLSLRQGALIYFICSVLSTFILAVFLLKVAVFFNIWHYILFDLYLTFLICSCYWFSFILCIFFQSATITNPCLGLSNQKIVSWRGKLLKNRRLYYAALSLGVFFPPLIVLLLVIIKSSGFNIAENIAEYNNSLLLNAPMSNLLLVSVVLNLFITPIIYVISFLYVFQFGLLNHILVMLGHIWSIGESVYKNN